jgi:hypothetical protein
MELTKELLDQYVTLKSKFAGKDKAMQYAHRVSFHVDGYDADSDKPNTYFARLIDFNRPGENDVIKKYRRLVYKSITKTPCDKVINSLKKMAKAPDFKIDYKESYLSSRISEEETLQEYCEENLPIYRNVMNWFLNSGMKQNITDPNGVIVVLPVSFSVAENEFLKPIPYYIATENVLYYEEGEGVLYKSDKVYQYRSNGRLYTENVVVFINKSEVTEITKEANGNYVLTPVYQFGFNRLPAFRPGGLHWQIIDGLPYYKSVLDGMLNYLDVAAREWSDLEAEVVQHMYSTMWYYASQDCTQCNGTGKTIKADGKQTVCGTCDGSGKMKFSPYNSIKVNPQQFGENPIPTPPAGYIAKPTEIVTIQDERIGMHIKNALGAIHMDFLVGADQSGVAKAIDRDELNNWVYSVAYHFVWNIIKPVYSLINDWRYYVVVPDVKQRKEMLPMITVPSKFELITANMIGDQVKQARDAQMDSTIINELEWEYARKAFNNDNYVLKKMWAEKAHDPFGTLSSEDIANLYLTGQIPKEDFILSTYISSFIERANNEVKGFLDMDFTQQEAVLAKYVAEKIKASKQIVPVEE